MQEPERDGARWGRERFQQKTIRDSKIHGDYSGYRESNPDYKTPSLAYYHYTTARFRAA